MIKNQRNYYRILQVQPDATQKVIKNNYRTLLQKMRLHPDLGGDEWNASLINKAFSILRNPAKRAAYDRELFRKHNISTISQGPLTRSRSYVKAHERIFSKEGRGNKRNYYRILHIQPDSPAAIIKTSYETLKKEENAPIELLNEAYQVLGNPTERENYDHLFLNNSRKCTSNSQVKKKVTDITSYTSRNTKSSIIHKRPFRSGSYEQLIKLYCEFCKTLHAHSPCKDSLSLCKNCNSPLFPPQENLLNQPRRSLSRIEQSGSIRIYLSWPGKHYPATLSDLSPTGMSMTMSQYLDNGQIIKIDGEDFRAVGVVTYNKSSTTQTTIGVRFLTVQFNNQKGYFFSVAI